MSMDYGVKERLLQFIKYIGSNPARFEKECGLANGYVRNIRKSISLDKLEQISKMYEHLNRQWLLTGEGDMLLTGDGKTGEESKTEGNQVSMDANVLDRILTALDKIVEQGARNQQQFDKVLEQSAKIQEQSAKNQEQFDKVLSLFDRLLTQRERGADNNPSVCSI